MESVNGLNPNFPGEIPTEFVFGDEPSVFLILLDEVDDSPCDASSGLILFGWFLNCFFDPS
jgi:hypothetical protein